MRLELRNLIGLTALMGQTPSMTQDALCSLHPYFQVNAGQLDAFKKLCERFMEQTKTEPGCQYYGFSFNNDQVHCREGYRDAEALLAHLKNVEATIGESLKIATLIRLEVHGPAGELDKLRGPMADLKPQFFTLEYGFRN